MRSADSYWAEAAKQQQAMADLIRERARLEAEVAALTQRVRDLSEPVPPIFRKAFAEEGE